MGDVRFRDGGMQDVQVSGGWRRTHTFTLGGAPAATTHTDTAISVDVCPRANFRVIRWARRPCRAEVTSQSFDEHLLELHLSRLARQHAAAMAPRLPRRPALPVLQARLSWPPAVRSWSRQPVRLRKGGRESRCHAV